MVSIHNATLALYLMPKPSGGVDFSMFTSGGASAGSAYNAGTIHTAIDGAERNKDKQLATIAKQPDVQKDIERYTRVLNEAETLDDVLADPVARRVLMKANGLGDQVDYLGLAKKALSSDPKDPNSLAAKLANVNGAWLSFVQKYDIANSGLDLLRPNNEGFAGSWRLAIEREGEPLESRLEVKQAGGAWQATVDGVPVPVTVKDDVVTIDLLWEDSAGDLHTTRLTGELGKNGLSGAQADDGKQTNTWSAEPWSAKAIQQVAEDYIAEKRLDMLDQQLPGLGTALLFKQVAASFDEPIKILGSKLGREVVTRALGIPEQIAVQSLDAQEKAIKARMNIKDLQNPRYVDQLIQRYLLATNGMLGGVTV